MHDPSLCERSKYTNLERVRRLIDAGPYAAILVMGPENVPYFSGFYNFDIRTIPERFHFVIWPQGGDPAFVVVQRRADLLTPADSFISDLRGYQGEGLDAIRAVAEALQDRGVTSGRVAIEGRQFPGGHLRELQRRLPNVTFEDGFDWIERIRAIKTPAEIELLTRAANLTATAIETAFKAAKPGDTERALAARMQYEMLKGGADLIAFPALGAGHRSGMWHALASDMPIENGMVIKTDSGAYVEGYYSDLARTAVMGRANEHQRTVHAKITEAKDRIVAGIKPGMTAAEAAHLGRKAYADQGLPFKWNILGHGIGMGIHELPQLYTYVDEPIEAGMTLMIETGYTDPPGDSFHVEDLILIEANGARYLTPEAAAAHAKIWEIGV